MRVAQLMFLDTDHNNNRVYNMAQNGSIIQVEYGRQGATMIKKKYPSSCWDALYKKKLEEGYVDRTEMFNLSANSSSEYKEIEDKEIRTFIDYLIGCSRKVVEQNVSISFDAVSTKMIEEAQKTIFKASQSKSLDEVNNCLRDLFIIIPRKMKDVKDCLPTSEIQIAECLEREQEILDSIKTLKITSCNHQKGKTILESNNIEARIVSKEEEDNIISHLDDYTKTLYKRAFRVKNLKTEENFSRYMKDKDMSARNIHFLYHGSGNANYWGIITEGLSINPDAPITGKMFGYGIYFAPKARKSVGYTDIIGSYWRGGHSKKAYLAVFKVCYKKPQHTETCRGFTGRHHLSNGYDACVAHAGIELRNDETIIYNEAQCTIQYLIELSI